MKRKRDFFWGGEIGKLGKLNFQTQLYHRPLGESVDKYFTSIGNLCLYYNTPKVQFLKLYQEIGLDILDILDTTNLTKFDTYQQVFKVGKKAHTMEFKRQRAIRLIDTYESIKKYGYCQGKYNHPKHAIHVKRGFYSRKYGNDPNGAIVLRRHHRAAACVALGADEAVCIFYKEKHINHYKW